jgi:CubicO group peptidase (beta-lactamase class C family)
MKKSFRSVAILVLLLTAVAVGSGPSRAQTPAVAGPKVIAGVLQPFVDSHVLAGAVTLVASKDKVLDLEAVGYADIAAKKPMRTDGLFWIASQSKPIAATALMMLVDEGKVKVDDAVEKYLPEFTGQMVIAEQNPDHVLLKKPKHPVLIRNLMTHTSGLRPLTPIEEVAPDRLPLCTAVRSYAMLPLLFEPDSKSLYSNAGVNTVGRIVEVVSGMPYEEFLDRRLFGPLGMKDTSFRPSAEQLKRLAKSYKPAAGRTGLEETPIVKLTYPLDDRRRQARPAGGLFSTAADLLLFYRMIAHGGVLDGKRYLSAGAVEQMTTKQTGALPSPYGFCFGTGGGRIGHAGSYGTNSSYDPRHQLITIYLIQQTGWRHKAGKKILAAVQQAATKAYGAVSPAHVAATRVSPEAAQPAAVPANKHD